MTAAHSAPRPCYRPQPDRIEIDRADQVGVTPGQLVLVGLFVDLGADLGHRLLDLDAGRGDIGDQRAGERAVGALLAVERGLAGAGGERDQRALAGFHLGKAGLYRHAAGSLAERILAANGLSRQASRNTSLTLASPMVCSSVMSTLMALPSLTSISDLRSASTGSR